MNRQMQNPYWTLLVKPVMTDQPLTEQAEMSASIGALAGALAAAQGGITGALKDSSNPFFKSKYADLASCWDACRGPLSANGLAVIQTTECNPDSVVVITTLAHSSGEWIRSRLPLKPKDMTPQGVGSAITYGRRYGLAAIVGLAQIDDDAEAAHGRHEAGKLEGSDLTPKKRDAYLPELARYIESEDDMGLRQLWDELSQQEQADMWRLLNSKQKAKARELLQKQVAA
jgi:hypothetical protein